MTNPQERGHFIGASKMADECMGVDTLIFLSDGPKHKAARELIKRAIKGFVVDFDAPPPPPPAVAHGPKSGASTANATEREVTQTMVATIYNRMFGVPPSEALLPVLMEYVDAGKLCILPVAVHHLMGNKVLKQVTRIRHTVKDELATTPGGKSLLEECRKSGLSQAESDAMLLQLADGFMFAGALLRFSSLFFNAVMKPSMAGRKRIFLCPPKPSFSCVRPASLTTSFRNTNNTLTNKPSPPLYLLRADQQA